MKMCYSGKCEFENYNGECTIYNSKKFEEKYFYTPCFIGGTIRDKEDKEYYESHIEEIERIKEKYYKEER